MAFIKRAVRVNNSPVHIDGIDTPDALIELARSNNIETSPLDLNKLSNLLGVTVRFVPMDDDDSGCLNKDKQTGTWVMQVNSLHHPNRQRFTMAHELGHFVKHSMINSDFADKTFFRNGETNHIEKEANFFAGELLMPEGEFIRFVKEVSGTVEDISNHFHVSTLAVRVRAKQLGFTGHNL